MPRRFYPKSGKIDDNRPLIRDSKGNPKSPPFKVDYKCKKCTLVIVDELPEHLVNWWGGAIKQFLGQEIEAVQLETVYKSKLPGFDDRSRIEYQYNKDGLAEKWNNSKDKSGLVMPSKIDKELIKEVKNEEVIT